jgi:hypothetical protein
MILKTGKQKEYLVLRIFGIYTQSVFQTSVEATDLTFSLVVSVEISLDRRPQF